MHPNPRFFVLPLMLGAESLFAQSSNQGTQSPTTVSALPKLTLVTAERIATIPASERAEWEKYLARSEVGSL